MIIRIQLNKRQAAWLRAWSAGRDRWENIIPEHRYSSFSAVRARHWVHLDESLLYRMRLSLGEISGPSFPKWWEVEPLSLP